MLTEPLVLLPNHAMRARRCHSAVVGLWIWEAVVGAALAWPFAAIVRGAYGTHPRTDAVLWDPGGLALLDLLVRRLPALGALVAHVAVVLIAMLVIGLLPVMALLVCLAYVTRERRTPRFRTAMARAAVAFGPCVRLLVVALVLEGSIVAAAATAASLADEGFAPKYGEVAADAIACALLATGFLALAYTGVLHDAARAAVVRHGTGAAEAIRAAVSAVRTAPLRILWSWGWRGLASLVPVAFGALLAARVGARGGWALATLFVIHQLVIGVRVALRASWLAKAMRAVDAAS